MDLKIIEKIQKIAITAMFSDDEFLEKLSLKGGNAMDLIHKISSRASIDLDFSICTDFEVSNLKKIETRIHTLLINAFKEEGLIIIDFKFEKKPKIANTENEDFWGGYFISFKVIEESKYNEYSNDINTLRRRTIVIGTQQKKTFRIDLSKFEYCDPREEIEFNGLTIYCYSPEMIMFEKLRALCQQTDEYKKVVKSMTKRARAKDFFDIFVIMKSRYININKKENIDLLKKIFKAKKVPLELIHKIRNDFEFHESDFESLRDTIKPGFELKSFKYYFDYVLDKFENIKT